VTEIVLAHGAGGPVETLVGIAPVVLGLLMLSGLVLLLSADRRREYDLHEGVRDETPSPGRQMFDGEYDWSHLLLVADVESAFEEERVHDVAHT
jgi:hypothetical protein